jgi:hypothetical protein
LLRDSLTLGCRALLLHLVSLLLLLLPLLLGLLPLLLLIALALWCCFCCCLLRVGSSGPGRRLPEARK